MADRTGVEWADATCNPLRARSKVTTRTKRAGSLGWHCVPVSGGCRACYAEAMNARLGTGLAFSAGNTKNVEIFLHQPQLDMLRHWRKPRVVFLNSMTDTFGEFVPLELIDRMYAAMARTPQHRFLVLTKRTARMRTYTCSGAAHDRVSALAGFPVEWPLANVWAGTSIEDQTTANQRLPILRGVRAPVRFVSAEPLLGEIDMRNHRVCDTCLMSPHERFAADPYSDLGRVWERDRCVGHWEQGKGLPGCDGSLAHSFRWLIAGGESGRSARPMDPLWPMFLRHQCQDAGVSFFFKQWGEHNEHGKKVGKGLAGRKLEGRTWNEVPQP